jgi:metal-responsive CopG/Arc/MetJ family transcriptional regulator
MATRKLTIDLTDDVLEEIERYKKSTQKNSTEEAVTELIRHALTLPPYFREFSWERAELEADEEIGYFRHSQV